MSVERVGRVRKVGLKKPGRSRKNALKDALPDVQPPGALKEEEGEEEEEVGDSD
jgi:hypothetical protein